MRTIAVILILSGLFAASIVLAEEVTEADFLRVRVLELQAELARRTLDAEVAAVRSKYKLGDGDAVDPQTRVIKRATKPTTKK